MSDGAPQQSMEDILSSIKRIITDDPAAVRRAPVATPAVSIDEDDVLELGAAPPGPEAAAGPLLSQTAEQASKAALAALATLSIDARAEANTLDGMVREMLRPMLKQWLDANLPELVERIVAREIARLGGR